MPKPKKTRRKIPLYRQKAPKPPKERGVHAASTSDATTTLKRPKVRAPAGPVHYHPIAPAHFTLREDGSIGAPSTASARSEDAQPAGTVPGAPPSPPRLAYHDDARKLWLYHGNSLELLDAIAAKYPEGRFDCIFADPPFRS